MTVFVVPNDSIMLTQEWDADASRMKIEATFQFYPQGLPAGVIARFTRGDSIQVSVTRSVFHGLTGLQMETNAKAQIDAKLEAIPDGPHSVVYV